MGYARLDVFWHDGRLESYILDKDTVSVGRATGNTIALDTDTISRYHFSIVRNSQGVTITDLDSANGTFVDGVQIKSNEAHSLAGVEEIQIGHLRMVYHALDENPTVPTTPIDDTQRIEKHTMNFRIELDLNEIDVWPAASTSTELSVTNTSEGDLNFDIGVDGMPAKWVRLNRGSLFVPAGETSHVLINVKTPRRPDIQPISYQAMIQVQPHETPNEMLAVPLQVHVRTYRGFGMALAERFVDSGEAVRLYLHNQGNAPLNLQLRGYAPQERLRFRFTQSALSLNAGQRAQVLLTFLPTQRTLIGRETIERFDIHVQSQDEAHFLAVESGKVLIKPLMPTWMAISIGGIVLSILLIMGLGILGLLTPPPAPSLLNFNASASQIEQGESVELAWDATRIAVVDVFANGTPLVTLNGDVTSYQWDTTEYAGEIVLQLIGTRGDERVTQSLNAFVNVPVRLVSFDVSPNPLIRNVVTALDLSWQVAGATSTRIEGLETFTRSLYPAEHGAIGQLEGIGGYATSAFNLTLYAENEIGTSVEFPVTVNVQDARCTTLQDVTLYEGPNIAYQSVGTFRQGMSIIIEAQDATSGWLLTFLSGNLRAWASRDFFLCDESFDPDQLRKEITLPPTPTSTPVPSPTTMPTNTPAPTVSPTNTP